MICCLYCGIDLSTVVGAWKNYCNNSHKMLYQHSLPEFAKAQVDRAKLQMIKNHANPEFSEKRDSRLEKLNSNIDFCTTRSACSNDCIKC